MSKAFTRESDDGRAEEISAPRPQLPAGAANYITSAGAQRLRQRLDALLEQRRSMSQTSTETGAAAQAEQKRLETLIRNLQATLQTVVVAEAPADPAKVAFGAIVTIRDDAGEEDEYHIVGVDEAEPTQGRISWISPLARALISKRAGEGVTFQAPAGTRKLVVVKVAYP